MRGIRRGKPCRGSSKERPQKHMRRTTQATRFANNEYLSVNVLTHRKPVPTPNWTLKVMWCQAKGTVVVQPAGTLSWEVLFVGGKSCGRLQKSC